MIFKVSFNSGTGNDDLDQENEDGEHGEPTIYEFQTEAERLAFIHGAQLAAEVTNGWVDAWVEVKAVDELLPVPGNVTPEQKRDG